MQLTGPRSCLPTREPVLQDPTGEELVGHLRDDGPPGAVFPSDAFVVDRLQAVRIILDQPLQNPALCASGKRQAGKPGSSLTDKDATSLSGVSVRFCLTSACCRRG